MRSQEITELQAFVAVAEQSSFRKAATLLDRRPSTLSHAIAGLEERLGVRLLNRNTRTVALTEAGEALLKEVRPALGTLSRASEIVDEYRAQPRGTLRLNVSEIAATLVLEPILGRLARDYPDIRLDIGLDNGFVDIIAQRFDAGIRLGGDVDQDMIAVRVSDALEAAIVAAPVYWAENPPPSTPRDLVHHRCINRRFNTRSGIQRWAFARGSETLSLMLDGPLILDSDALMRSAALQGVGVALLSRAAVQADLDSGRLVPALEAWCPAVPAFYLYYPHARHKSASLQALIELLRVRD